MRFMKRVSVFLLAFILMVNTFNMATISFASVPSYDDLIISEYIEGSSNNKAIEIYNGTGSQVNLSEYTLELYSNGSLTVSNSVELLGTLADGDVYVVAHGSADKAILDVADLEDSGTINHNGDDVYVLKKGTDIIDSIGQIGVRSDYSGALKDQTLIRINAVRDTDPANVYDPTVDWDSKAKDIFTFLGSHTPVDVTPPVTLDLLGNLRDTNKYSLGDPVEVEGVITYKSGTSTAYIQEEDKDIVLSSTSQGIKVYSKDNFVDANLGDLVKVKGVLSEYNGELQVYGSEVEVVANDKGSEVSAFLTTPLSIMNGDYQGTLVSIKAAKINSIDGQKVHFVDIDGNPLLGYCGFDSSFLVVDQWYSFVGIGTFYNVFDPPYNGNQVFLRNPIEITQTVEPIKIEDIVNARDISKYPNNSSVIVEGTVSYVKNSYTAYIQDSTAGIMLYTKGIDLTGYIPGDHIVVEGVTSEYNEEKQIKVDAAAGGIITIKSQNQPLSSRTITIAQLLAGDFQGELVSASGLEIVEINGNSITLQDSQGNKAAIWCGSAPDFDSANYEVGKIYSLIALANKFSKVPQFTLLNASDFTEEAVVQGTIIEARKDENTGNEMTVSGLVTFVYKYGFYMEDSTHGIFIDVPNYNSSLVSVGDIVEVKGIVGVSNGERKVIADIDAGATISVKSSGNPVLPKALQIGDITGDAYQGMFVSIDKVKVTKVNGNNIDVVDIDGNLMPMYCGNASNYISADYKVGNWYSLNAMVAYFGNNQFKLRVGSDMVETSAPIDLDAGKPLITNIEPINMSSTTDTELTLSFEITEGDNPIDFDTVEVYHNGILVPHTVLGNVVSAQLTGLALGTHEFKASVQDNTGLKGTREWSCVVLEETDYDFYFGIPHSHTEYSDGKGTPTQALDYARNNDLDWIFITDHSNWFDGVKYEKDTSWLADSNSPYYISDYDANEEKKGGEYVGLPGSEWTRTLDEITAYNNAHNDFIGIRGFEMTFSKDGHMNVIGSENYVEAKSQMSNLNDFYDWVENLSEVQADQIVASFNHPNWPSTSFNNQAYVPALDDEISMMEVGNGAPPYSYARSEEQFIKALDNGWHLAPTNGQDNHSTNWGDGDNLTGIIAKDLTEDSLLEAIINRRVYSTETRNLELTVKANGQWMGSIVDVDQGETLSFEIIATDNEEPIKKIVILTNSGVVQDEITYPSALTTATWNTEITVPAGANWYMVKVIHENGKWGTAAPIFTPESDQDVKFTLLEIDPDIALPGTETEINATVSNMGIYSVSDIEVKFYKDSVDPSNLIGTVTADSIPAGESKILSVNWTPMVDGETKIIAKMTEIPNVTTVTEISKTINVVPSNGKTILIDNGHKNYDVPGGINAFINMLRQYGYNVVLTPEGLPLTSEMFKDVDVFVATHPDKDYTTQEEDLMATWTKQGGSILYAAKSNYNNDSTRFNGALEAMGSGIRFNDDNVYEPIDSPYYSGGMSWSVYAYNLPDTPSKINEDMEAIRMFSACSLIDENGTALTNDPLTELEIVLAGNDSSYNAYVGAKGYSYNKEGELNGEAIPMIAKENIEAGKLVAAGRHLFSDYEIGNDVSNSALTLKLIDWLAGFDRIKTIQQVKDEFKAGVLHEGDMVTITGKATVDEEVLFDVIYIQDDTAGVSLYGSYQDNPVDVLEGTVVIASGVIKIFEGEMEIAYDNYKNQVLYVGPSEKIVPQEVTTQVSMDEMNTGRLMTTKGYITEVNEAGSYMKIDDGSGEAYVHIDGYVGVTMADFKVGDGVWVTGLGSKGANGPRIRVRYTEDVVKGEVPLGQPQANINAKEPRVVLEDNTTEIVFTIDLGRVEDVNALEFDATFDDTALSFKEARVVESGLNIFAKDKGAGLLSVIGYNLNPMDLKETRVMVELVFTYIGSAPVQYQKVVLSEMNVTNATTNELVQVDIHTSEACVEIIKNVYDANLDGKVDLSDLSFAVAAYQVDEGDTNWDQVKYADVNNDKVIDAIDFMILMTALIKQ